MPVAQDIKKGDKVAHIRFGVGTVIKIEGKPENLNPFKGEFDFDKAGRKKLLIRLASLHKVL